MLLMKLILCFSERIIKSPATSRQCVNEKCSHSHGQSHPRAPISWSHLPIPHDPKIPQLCTLSTILFPRSPRGCCIQTLWALLHPAFLWRLLQDCQLAGSPFVQALALPEHSWAVDSPLHDSLSLGDPAAASGGCRPGMLLMDVPRL